MPKQTFMLVEGHSEDSVSNKIFVSLTQKGLDLFVNKLTAHSMKAIVSTLDANDKETLI